MQTLDDLSYLQLEATLKALAGGKIGFDTRRDPRTNRKASLAEYIASTYGEAEVLAMIAKMPWEPNAAKQAPAANDYVVAPPAPKAVTPKAPTPKPPKTLAEQLADALENPLDEDRVRAICHEEFDAPVVGLSDKVDKVAAAHERLATDSAVQFKSLREAMEKVAERPILHVQIKDAPKVVIEDHVHPLFVEVLALVNSGLNVMLKGPAGCGKTHMCEQIAKYLKRDFGTISGSAGASESQLTGRLLPTGDAGRFEYHQSPFINLYENGGVFLFDELDAFDPNMLLVVNTALANGHFTVEARSNKPTVCRHAESVLLGATNTFGTGPDAVFVGRNQLDGATLDRWYVVEMDYDKAFEKQLASAEIVNWCWSLRDKVNSAKMKRVVSTRMIQKYAAAKAAGRPDAEIRKRLLAGWTRDELAKAGVAA